MEKNKGIIASSMCFAIMILGILVSGCLGPGGGGGGGTGDKTPPHVSTVNPAQSATGVELTLDKIQVAFDEAMVMTSEKYSITVNGSFFDYTLQWPDNRTLNILPDSLPADTTIRITLDNYYFKDLAGNQLLDDYTWSFKTRQFNIIIQNDQAFPKSSGYYEIIGEVVSQETKGIVAYQFWPDEKGSDMAALKFDVSYYDSGGKLVISDFCLTADIIAFKFGEKIPFRCLESDPNNKINSYMIVINSTWSSLYQVPSPYQLSVNNVQASHTITGDYKITGSLQNPGNKNFDPNRLHVIAIYYESNGKVHEYGDWQNSYIISAGASSDFEITISDILLQIKSNYVIVSLIYP